MRSEHLVGVGLAVSCALVTAGCVDFDDSIYKNLDPDKVMRDGGNGGTDEGGKALDGGNGGTDGGNNGKDSGEDEDAGDPTPRLVDRCDDATTYRLTTALLSPKNDVEFIASTENFTNDINQTMCFAYPLPGSEASMVVEMNAGERWHFHITPRNQVGMGQGKQNPVIYMRNDCSDNRGCNEGTFLDLCGDGEQEHFTFQSETKSTWHFILDDRNNVQGDYSVRAVKTVCGNGIQEHNEACDSPGQGNCSPDCRLIVSDDNMAPEPNDDFSAAAILGEIDGTTGGAQTVRDSIGGYCDIDYYAFAVPDKGKVGVTILSAAGNPCGPLDASVSRTKLELLGTDAKTVLGVGTTASDTCPSFANTESFANNLNGGLYYLRVSGEETKSTFSYQLRINVGHD